MKNPFNKKFVALAFLTVTALVHVSCSSTEPARGTGHGTHGAGVSAGVGSGTVSAAAGTN